MAVRDGISKSDDGSVATQELEMANQAFCYHSAQSDQSQRRRSELHPHNSLKDFVLT
jgi:hypothetical protein